MSDEAKPGAAKAKPFILDLTSKAEVETSIGTVNVYDGTWRDVTAYVKQPAGDTSAQMRSFLGKVSSFCDDKKAQDFAALGAEQVAALTADDLERVATGYLSIPNSAYLAKKASQAKPPLVRADGESSLRFLDRLIRWHETDHKAELQAFADQMDPFKNSPTAKAMAELLRREEETKRLFDRNFGGASQMLHDLNLKAGGLADFAAEERKRLDSFSAAVATPIVPKFDLPDMSAPVRAAAEAGEQWRKERREQLEATRSIGDLTQRSASLLADMSKASATMLEQFGAFLVDFRERAKHTDRSARLAIWIAAVSLVLTAVISGIALAYAVGSFYQDRRNNESTDKWQAEVLSGLNHQAEIAGQEQRTLAAENAQLRLRVEVLERAAQKKAGTRKTKRP
ncbi:MAG TPA: hypothetical protein VFB08_02215 [Burkholderiales bacterium]|nr:hypothetical protein [Burkholderiales bacterium]